MRRINALAVMLLSCLLVMLLPGATHAQAGKTQITWYGHAAFKVVTPQGHVLYLDPWIINPVNPDGQADLDAITKADLVLVSHGHFDHVGNAVEIAKKTGARLVTTFDLGNALASYGGYPKTQMGYDSLGNFGGSVTLLNGDVTVTFIPAVHSSGVSHRDAQTQAELPEYGGNPGGFLISIKDGPTLYHTGDTDLFGDMALISHHRPVDVMLACIGDHFTMGPERAAEAVALVNPKTVIPMHYGTFPEVLPGTVEDFQAALKARKLDTRLKPITLEKSLEF